jgi:hypothetical protein
VGYFSNGSEADTYQAQWCDFCVHMAPTTTCPIWDLHLLYNYDQQKRDTTRRALEMFIPRAENGGNDRCKMFVEDPDRAAHGIERAIDEVADRARRAET